MSNRHTTDVLKHENTLNRALDLLNRKLRTIGTCMLKVLQGDFETHWLDSYCYEHKIINLSTSSMPMTMILNHIVDGLYLVNVKSPSLGFYVGYMIIAPNCCYSIIT